MSNCAQTALYTQTRHSNRDLEKHIKNNQYKTNRINKNKHIHRSLASQKIFSGTKAERRTPGQPMNPRDTGDSAHDTSSAELLRSCQSPSAAQTRASACKQDLHQPKEVSRRNMHDRNLDFLAPPRLPMAAGWCIEKRHELSTHVRFDHAVRDVVHRKDGDVRKRERRAEQHLRERHYPETLAKGQAHHRPPVQGWNLSVPAETSEPK